MEHGGDIKVYAKKDELNARLAVAERDEGEAMRLAIELGISVFIDKQNGYTGAFFMNPDGTRGPMMKESYAHHSCSTTATLLATCKAASLLINGAGTQAYPWTA